jgi:hypothetical protein
MFSSGERQMQTRERRCVKYKEKGVRKLEVRHPPLSELGPIVSNGRNPHVLTSRPFNVEPARYATE